VLAWVVGLGMMHKVVGKEPLVSTDPQVVIRHVLRAMSVLLERVDTDPVG